MRFGRRLGEVLALMALVLAAAGCPSSRFSLTVRLQSGLRAGHEVRFVEGRLYRGSVPCTTDAAPLTSAGRALAPGDQSALTSGSLALTTFERLEPGLYTVRARFRRPPTDPRTSSDSGPVLVERCLVTSLSSDRIVRIALTSDCLEVACPAPAGSPAFDQCLNGRCVDPRCDPEDPSTADFCCDRAALGDACDTDPTLCEDASDCMGTLACALAQRCEDGVCVEPETDACPAGEYCDATLRMCAMEPPPDTMDAGLPDASVPPADAPQPDAYRDDAFVPPGADAALDAFVPPADPEDCTLEGDEDLNGSSDCGDPACATELICRDPRGCAPLRAAGPAPAEPIPTPTHWYRSDQQVIVGALDRVCAWRDLVGGRPFLSVDPPRLTAGVVDLNGADMRAAGDLGMDLDGDYTVFVAWATAPAGGGPLLSTFVFGAMYFFQTFHGASPSLSVRGGASYRPGPEGSGIQYMTVVVGTLREGAEIASAVRHALNGSPLVPASAGGSPDTAGPDVAGEPETHLAVGGGRGLSVYEVVVYDRVLDETERLAVDGYLRARYVTD